MSPRSDLVAQMDREELDAQMLGLVAAFGARVMAESLEAAVKDAAFEVRGTPTGDALWRAGEHLRRAAEEAAHAEDPV